MSSGRYGKEKEQS